MSGIFVQHVEVPTRVVRPVTTVMRDGSLPDLVLVAIGRTLHAASMGSLRNTIAELVNADDQAFADDFAPRRVACCLAWLRRRGLVLSYFSRETVRERVDRVGWSTDAQSWQRMGIARIDLGDGRVEWGVEVAP